MKFREESTRVERKTRSHEKDNNMRVNPDANEEKRHLASGKYGKHEDMKTHTEQSWMKNDAEYKYICAGYIEGTCPAVMKNITLHMFYLTFGKSNSTNGCVLTTKATRK